jgi:hypothetical protein
MEQEIDRKARVTGWGVGSESVTISHLKPGESDLIEGAINGHQWVGTEEGRVVAISKNNPLPSPTDDEKMLPFWRRRQESTSEMQEVLIDTESLHERTSFSLYISSPCGYGYTPEMYKVEAEKLTRWGFVCMRSQRTLDGKYWEVWYLCGLWSAKNELEESIKYGNKDSEKEKLEKALDFLATNSSFGSLEATVQRLAMPTPD